MDNKEKLSVGVYNLVVNIRDTLSLPTHSTIAKTFYYSLLLLVCSIVSELLGFYTFISWYGCLTCVIVLTILLWIERRENDALLKMYRTARLSAEKVVCRAKAASINVGGERSSNQRNRSPENVGKRGESSDTEPDQ